MPTLEQVQVEKARRSFYEYVKQAWHIVEPGTKFVDNWHIKTICLPYAAKITTTAGEMCIGDLVEKRWAGLVLSWDQENGRPEWRPVTVQMKSSGRPLVNITFNDGASIAATDNHPVYVVEKGYVPAGNIRPGDVVLRVQGVRRSDSYLGQAVKVLLSRVLSQESREGRRAAHVQAMWRDLSSLSSSAARWILQHALFRPKQNASAAMLRRLWAGGRAPSYDSLPGMSFSVAEERKNGAVSVLRDTGLSQRWRLEDEQTKVWRVLWARLLRGIREGSEESSFHKWWLSRAIRRRIQEQQEVGFAARWTSLFSLRPAKSSGWQKTANLELGRASHRLEQGEQRFVESRDLVQALSQSTEGHAGRNLTIVQDVVAAVERSLRIPDVVYNIEVEGNHNYFADGVLVHNCDHLQAVTEGKITRLIINVPPRTLKSTIVSVLWPTWEWGPAGKPHLRYVTASHNAELSTRDAVATRRVLQSDWYRRRYPDVRLTGDQNVKTRYENTKRGYRIATSVDAGFTGEGGNRILVDDPHDMKKIFSDVYRMAALGWWDNTMSTRLNDQAVDAVVLIMQRGHTEDMTGHFLKMGVFQHVCLPMRYDGVRRSSVLGEYDQRTEKGELLFERRFPDGVLKALEITLGSYGTAGQLQQQPIPMGGTIFKRDCWQYYKVLPQLDELVISVDCAFKSFESSDFVAIQAWGRKAANKYLVDRVKEHLGFAATVETIRQMKRKYPNAIAILIEDAANGPAVIETLSKEIAGVLPIQPQGGKVARAYAIQPQQEAGNIWLPDSQLAPWIHDYLTELSAFPGAPNDDETDATTQAMLWYELRGAKPSVMTL